ncbi:MAG: hypothetical protein ABIM99_04300 [Candidatus Dojkabacteria bacterium]
MLNKNKIPLYILSCFAVLSLCLIALAASYYLVIYLPQKDKEVTNSSPKTNQDNQSTKSIQDILDEIGPPANKSVLLDNCINDAYTAYKNNWNNDCINNGLGTSTTSGINCSLPASNANRWDQLHKESTDLCIQLYK